MALTSGKGDSGTGSRAAKPTGGKGKGGKGGKGTNGKGSNVTDLAAAAAKGDTTAASALSRIVKSHQALIKADEAKDKVMTKTKEAQDASEAAFRDDMDLGTAVGATDEDYRTRLQSVESKWEAYKDAVADAITKRNEASGKVKTAKATFERSMEAGAQRELFPDLP